jgi:hypothetical protein
MTNKRKRQSRSSAVPVDAGGSCLLGGHFFLFAFHAHEFELALCGVDG